MNSTGRYRVGKFWRRWAVYDAADDSRHSTWDTEADAQRACDKANDRDYTRTVKR